MKQPIRIILSLLCAASVFTASQAQKKKPEPVKRDTAKTVQLTSPAKPKTGPKPYGEVITASAVTRNGLIRIHQVDDKWFFEINDSLLNRDILVVNRIAKAPANTRSGFFGYAGDEINQNVIRFEKGPNNRIFLRNISFSVYSRDTAGAMYKSVMKSNVQPIAAVFDIKAYATASSRPGVVDSTATKDSTAKDTSTTDTTAATVRSARGDSLSTSADTTGSVIEVTSILNGDNELFFFANSVKTNLRLGSVQADRSYILDIRSYPINTEIRTVKTYSRSAGPQPPGSPPAPPSGGFATFELNSSLVILPADPMRPRYFDDRVAYFTTEFTDFDADPQGVKDVSVITRWRLEPKPEDADKYKQGEAVEPVKPIIFYIDPATPAKWVPYLIQGVNDWQAVFEKAGFKNAIRGRIAPTRDEDSTWSLEDARFSAIVYKPSDIPNAMGPHIHDPRTGEILESHINWYHNVMNLLQRWYTVQAAANDPRARKPAFSDSLMGQLIRFVSSHEVGHTLGLPHNMGASFATPVEKLRDREWLEKHGHSASIMDYARFNYVAQPEDSVGEKGIFPRINDYDEWAIEWGYKLFPGTTEEEEKKILNDWVKSKASNPRLRFLHFNTTDPRAQTEDLGDNAMKAGFYGLKNLKRILPQFPEWLKEEGENYDKLDQLYGEVVTQYTRFMSHAMKNIGGIYTDHKTTDQAGSVYSIVPRTTQKEAMTFLHEHLFNTPDWLLNKKILSLISAPTSDRLSAVQDNLLASLMAHSRMQRIIAQTNREPNAYTLDDLLTDLRRGLFSELGSKRTIDNHRRNLQKSFVERLENIVKPSRSQTSPSGGGFSISFGPVLDIRKSDIVSVSKATLRELRTQISNALPGYPDAMSRYHLIDVRERIDAALKID